MHWIDLWIKTLVIMSKVILIKVWVNVKDNE